MFKFKFKTQMEIFNETILMLTMYTMICFSPFVPDVLTRFKLGYVTILIVCVHLLLNLTIIFITTFVNCKLCLRKRSLKRQYKRSRKLLQQRLREGHEKTKERLIELFAQAEKEAEKKIEQEFDFSLADDDNQTGLADDDLSMSDDQSKLIGNPLEKMIKKAAKKNKEEA